MKKRAYNKVVKTLRLVMVHYYDIVVVYSDRIARLEIRCTGEEEVKE